MLVSSKLNLIDVEPLFAVIPPVPVLTFEVYTLNIDLNLSCLA
jgi:hypothetical protein